jgi:hypothetical protein
MRASLLRQYVLSQKYDWDEPWGISWVVFYSSIVITLRLRVKMWAEAGMCLYFNWLEFLALTIMLDSFTRKILGWRKLKEKQIKT